MQWKLDQVRILKLSFPQENVTKFESIEFEIWISRDSDPIQNDAGWGANKQAK